MKIEEYRQRALTLYRAVNNLIAKLGFEGEIDNRDILVERLHEAVGDLDEGVFCEETFKRMFDKVEILPGQESLFRTQLEQDLLDMRRQRDEMGAWLRQEGHDCEFYIDPERGKCDWCEMMGQYFADNNIAFGEEDE